MKDKFNYNLLLLFIFLLNIILVNLTPLNNTRNINNYNSVITLLIKGNGIQNLINNKFTPSPTTVLINGIRKNFCKRKCYIKRDKNNINNITLFFKGKIASCQSMFKNLDNVIEIDLSKFDFSEVKNMENMFSGLINLKRIYFGNLNISSIENLNCLFYNCYKLTSIDLSNFNSSKITNMQKMFYGCKSLKYLNLYYFKINNNINIENIFDGISSDTKYCISDEEIKKYLLGNYKLLDCSITFSKINRKTRLETYCGGNLYKYNGQCLQYCPGGTYVYSSCYYYSSPSSTICYKKCGDCYNTCKSCNGAGSGNNHNCKECKAGYEFINNNKNCYLKCQKYYYINFIGDILYRQCVDACPNNYNKLIEEKKMCVNDCKNDDNYRYEYNNKCYQSCPSQTYVKEDYDDYMCYSEAPEGYYLDSSYEVYKKCYLTCKTCNNGGDINNNNCIECINNYGLYTNSKNISNCYEKCKGYYYFDKSNKFNCVETCQGKYNKTIISNNKCIDDCQKDDKYKYEYNNTCYEKCPNNTYILEDKENNICYDKTRIGYYLDKENNRYKKCYDTCNKCDKKGDEINNNCLECKVNYTFYNNSNNISNCYEICKYYYYFDESNEFNCVEYCSGNYNKTIISKNKCIDDCSKDDIYKYEYNNICYEKCPNNTYTLEDNEDNICYDKAPIGYYLDKEKEIYKRCYNTCSTCDKGGNDKNNNCLECIDNYTFYNNSLNIQNCYETCKGYYYFDESNIFHCVETCQGNYNKIIKDKNKCIDDCSKDDKHIYEYNNICYEKCPNDTYILEDNEDNICYDKTPIGYYLDKENNRYKKCYYTCNKCNKGGDKINNNCLECKDNYTFH